MAQKDKIEYVTKYYSYGSEAVKVEAPVRKPLRELMPKIPLERFQNIYIDPVAMICLTLAMVLSVVLIMGSVHMRDTREEYDQMRTYLSDLKRENARLSHIYHTSYDLEEVRAAAKRIGMIDAEEAERFTVFFSVPAPKEEPSAWDEFVWLVTGLFSNPKRAAE